MRRIAVMNQKGGVGKTTSSVNLAAALANEGRKVCLIDLDPRGHGSLHTGVEPHSDEPSVYDVFSGTRTLREVRHHVADNLWVIPASLDLAATEVELVDAPNREIVLRQAMEKMMQESPVDYVIMDCPPLTGY
ncbi:MAG: AAA family ATPase [Planctomycetaceae bacterium]